MKSKTVDKHTITRAMQGNGAVMEKYGMSLVESLNRDIARCNDEIEKLYSMTIWREDKWGRYVLIEDFCEPEEAGFIVVKNSLTTAFDFM